MIVRISTEHIDEEPSLLRKSTRCSLNMSISWMKMSPLGTITFCKQSLQTIKNQKLKINVFESSRCLCNSNFALAQVEELGDQADSKYYVKYLLGSQITNIS